MIGVRNDLHAFLDHGGHGFWLEIIKINALH